MTQTVSEPDVNDVVRRVVRALLHASGMPVPQLAGLLNLHKASVQRRLNGEIPFTVQEVEKLARYFGQRIDAFYVGQINLVAIPPQALSMYLRQPSDLAFCAA